MNGAFAGKVVLITGGARNLGRAMGVAFAGAGASIAINARSEAACDREETGSSPPSCAA